MNAEENPGYKKSKILLYCKARLRLIKFYILKFNAKKMI